MSVPLVFRRCYAVRALPRPKDPLKTSTRATTYNVAPGVTLTHRPPPTAPTPHSLTTAPASPLLALKSTPPAPPPPDAHLPPPVRKPRLPPVVLTPEQVNEIRELRQADPVANPTPELARRFGCSPAYVRTIASHSKAEAKAAEARRLAAEKKEEWGERKRLVRELRERRRDFW